MTVEDILLKLKDKFPDVEFILDNELPVEPYIVVPPIGLNIICEFLRDDEELLFDSIMNLSGVDDNNAQKVKDEEAETDDEEEDGDETLFDDEENEAVVEDTTEDNENSKISDIAGRAPFILIFAEKGNFLKSIKNPALSMGGGASAEVVSLLVKESCKIFVAGKFGFKMQSQLRSNNIEYIEKQGLAKNIIKSF